MTLDQQSPTFAAWNRELFAIWDRLLPDSIVVYDVVARLPRTARKRAR